MDLGLSIGGGEQSRRNGVRSVEKEARHPSLQLELKLSWPNELGNTHEAGFSGNLTTTMRSRNPNATSNGRDNYPETAEPSPSTSRSTTVERACNNWRCSDEEDGGGGGGGGGERNPRKKLRLTKEQSCYLEESFKEHTTLNPKQKLAIAKKLNLRPRQVEVWFQNRRARTKLKQTEVDYECLKRCCESLREENRRLHKELQELRALKSLNPNYRLHLPATTLIMCPSCERATTKETIGRKPSSFYPKLAYQVS